MISCTTLAHIEEMAKALIAASGRPSYSFGRDGNHPSLTWLDADGKPSNKVGIPFGLNNGQLTELWVGNELLVAYDLTLYHHLGDEVSLTSLVTVSMPAGVRTKRFTISDFGIITVPKDVQIAAQISSVVSTNPRRTGCHATIIGSV